MTVSSIFRFFPSSFGSKKKGQEMKGFQSYLVIVAAILLLASCSSVQSPLAQLKPLTAGEARLTEIEMPELIREDLPYDVILRVNSEETPQISRVCFRWLSEGISSASPSLNCYAARGDFGTGNPCYSRTSVISPGSDSFCVEASDIKTDVPGRLIVRIRPTGLLDSYNKLEGQAEYVYDGQLRVTNAVKTSVTIDKQE